jgi:class 3 adenylate cyclase
VVVATTPALEEVMLLNFWMPDEDPEATLPPDLRRLWKDHVARARREALDGRFPRALQELERLLDPLREAGMVEAWQAVRLERARLPQGASERPNLNALHKVWKSLNSSAQNGTTRVLLLCLARSELQLLQFQNRCSMDPDKSPVRQFSEAQQELVLNRARAISGLGRRHPAVGLLNLHLGHVSHGLRDLDTAVEFFEEALACFRALPADHFAHECSDALLHLGEVALDLGFLDQAEGLLHQARYCKSCPSEPLGELGERVVPLRPPWQSKPGVSLSSEDERVLDRPGLARCLVALGRLAHQQGRLYDALDAYTTSRRVGGTPRYRGFFANRVAEIFLEAEAFDLARQVFRHNLPAGEEKRPRELRNAAIARMGLARAELTRALPPALGGVEGPHHRQQRRQARDEATRLCEQARGNLAALSRGFTGSDTPGVGAFQDEEFRTLEGLRYLLEGHRLLDTQVLDEEAFAKVRVALTALARDGEALQPTFAGSLLWDLVRLELWAWQTHHWVPPLDTTEGAASTFDRLLELWESRGACERLERLQDWAETVGLADASRVLLNRYLPQPARGETAQQGRVLTILFADLRDSCGHGQEARLPEDIAQLQADLFRAINPVVRRHGGTILRYQGDSILVVFGLHSQDHADQAVSCALELQAAVRRLNVFRSAQSLDARPLELPVGIHTGEASVAHLMIPGRREVTVYGNAVNLAKRIQEAPRADRSLFEPRAGAIISPLDELILVSGATFQRLRRGGFRAFPLGGPLRFKGYENDPMEVFSIRPLLPLRCSFVGMGTHLTARPGVLALDVGNEAGVGVVDHHQAGTAGCATSLALEHPAWLTEAVLPAAGQGPRSEDVELIVHADPDFDVCAAVFMALEFLEGRPGAASRTEARQEALRALAGYATRVDSGHSDIDDLDPAASPYALLAVCEGLANGGPVRPPSWLARQRRWLGLGVQVLHETMARAQQTVGRESLPSIFRKGVPAILQPLAEQARADVSVFTENDLRRIAERHYDIPRRGGTGRVVQRCGVIQAPACRTFKEWARRRGYAMLVVGHPERQVRSADERQQIALRRFIISVLPDSGLTLADLAVELDRLETQRREELHRRTGITDLLRNGPPRPGFSNSDPWYDGRAPVLANTIVDAPRGGSVLELDDILATLDALYSC